MCNLPKLRLWGNPDHHSATSSQPLLIETAIKYVLAILVIISSLIRTKKLTQDNGGSL